MLTEIRTYTANRGMLDGLINLLNGVVFPNHKKYGIEVLGLWVDRPRNEVVWIRTFASTADRQEKLSVYEASSERHTGLPLLAYHLARAPDVQLTQKCFNPGDVLDESLLSGELADRARQAFAARNSTAAQQE